MRAPRLGRSGLVYISSVILAGLCIGGVCLYQAATGRIGSQWLLLAALTAVSASASVGLIFVQAAISISDVFVFAAMLLVGPAAGALTAAVDGLVSSCWMKTARREPHRLLFNVCMPIISVWCAGRIFFATAGLPTSGVGQAPISTLILPLLFAALCHFAINTGFIAGALALEMDLPFLQVWKRNFTWMAMPFLASASLALLLLSYTRRVTVGDVALLAPVLGLVYFAFRTVSGRMGDTNRHLGQLNRLYLSTIEALAMAIDAKDQVTHGHIRRVQRRAVALAREIGVDDELEIKAIEAAALLHDTGKIAIPEHILNKPGKLTPAEFEVMKGHARIGADILSSIEFPFPVVPIVRHHHENWDGSGYPDGLRGEVIPIGARVLAVVDCYDALTSDRPYRRAMTEAEALAILEERRGAMYDPRVVDAFVRARATILAEEVETAPVEAPLALAEPLPDAPAAPRMETAHLVDWDPETQDDRDRAELLLARIARSVPFDLAVLYVYDRDQHAIVAAARRGWHERTVAGLTFAIGDRLSGWVAATRRPILNGDPALDFAGTPAEAGFRSLLSVPLADGGELAGVLTLYAASAEAFTARDQHGVEAIAGPASDIARAVAGGRRGGGRYRAPAAPAACTHAA